MNDDSAVRFYGYKHWTLEEPRRCFYVGKGTIGRANSKRRNHKWHAIVRRFGLHVEICVGPMTNGEACDWEIANIASEKTFSTCHDHDADDIGCNFTIGGEGTVGRHVSAEQRERLANAQRGEKSAWYGKKHTDETRQKIACLKTGLTISDTVKVDISTKLLGGIIIDRGPEWRAKIAEANKHRDHRLTSQRHNIRKFNKVSDQLVLLVGGPDRCGKTNIIAELSKQLRIKSFKASSEHKNFTSDQDNFLNELKFCDLRIADMLFQIGTSVIFDRAYMCEWVYSQFYNRPTDMQMLRKVDTLYAHMGAKILICTRKSFDGICDDLDPKLNANTLPQISKLYGKFCEWTKCQTMTMYVDDQDLQRQVRDIIQFVNVRS